MLKCPECGTEMIQKNKRIKWHALIGKSKGSLARRSYQRRVWHCLNCNKWFGFLQRLVEVEIKEA